MKRQIVPPGSAPCCPTPCVPTLRALSCRAEPRAPVAAVRPNAFWSKLHCPSICRAESSEIACRAAAASAYRPPGCGEGRVPRVPSPVVAACGCTVQRALLRARPVHIQRRAQRARIPLAPRGRMAPASPSEPQMCAECEDDAEREIVLDTARGGAYYSILRQARKRLSESRGASPQAGTLRTGYWTDGITFYY